MFSYWPFILNPSTLLFSFTTFVWRTAERYRYTTKTHPGGHNCTYLYLLDRGIILSMCSVRDSHHHPYWKEGIAVENNQILSFGLQNWESEVIRKRTNLIFYVIEANNKNINDKKITN